MNITQMVGISWGMSHVKWDSGTVKIMGLISTFDQLGLNWDLELV